MEGSRAFQTLEELFAEDTDIKSKLLEAKRYLKADFKVHLARQTDVLQHCIGYALSSTEKEFQLLCQHNHINHCQSCIDVDEILEKIVDNAGKKQVEKKDSLMFTVEKCVNDIRDLQRHIVRSKNQEMARRDISNDLEIYDVMITSDWAMKFLPRRYREGQLDWFAKRGINWHVSVSLIKMPNRLQTITHLHIFSAQATQDAATTTAVMTDVVKDLKAILPNVHQVHIFSDNAGCYKSSLTLSTLRHDIGDLLSTYNFSEAQNGKGPCDRKAAHAKFVIKRYINEGRDVTTALDMKKALEKFGDSTYRVRVVDTILDIDADKRKESIKNISNFFNFHFSGDGIRMWQAYKIGEGKLVKWDSLKPTKNSVQLKVISDWTDLVITESFEETVPTEIHHKQIWTCPMENCVREFKNKEFLDQHLLQGQCEYQLEKQYLTDRSKILYSQKLANAPLCCPDINSKVFEDPEISNKSSGWALKTKKKKTVFNQKQRDFMVEKFKIGKRTGSKIDGYTAAEEMRTGHHGFTKDEFLTGQQIASYFSRLAQQDRKSDSSDFQAAEEESRRSNLKKEIIETLDM